MVEPGATPRLQELDNFLRDNPQCEPMFEWDNARVGRSQPLTVVSSTVQPQTPFQVSRRDIGLCAIVKRGEFKGYVGTVVGLKVGGW